MLTPRRTVLLLAGFVLFAGAYGAYAQVLGWLDGLPQLPPQMLIKSEGGFTPPPVTVSPTQQKIVEAFGEKSPETNYSHYETQVEFRNGDTSLVVAAGKAPSNPKSKRVTLMPFSVAVFGKPKPAHLRQPGEVTEISTIHADKGTLEFDREIANAADMKKAKLVRLELVSASDFEDALPDPRRGIVHLTNNQRSADPNRFMVVRTVGPVFYRDPKAVVGTPDANGPDLWTDAPVEIVDRQNLPRPIGSTAPATAAAKGEESRAPGAVAAILSGQRLPPPTLTAVGLRVYLEPEPPPGQKKKEPKPGAISGVRRLEFLEQVLVNLWIDNARGLGGPADPRAANPNAGGGLALIPPPPAIAAVTGNLGPAAYSACLANRALLQIDTRGPFTYDAAKGSARFDVMPSDPNLPNDVQVTKLPAHAGASSMFSQVLELELNGGPTGGERPANTPPIKRLHAWTTAPGRYVTLTDQAEATEAYGQDFVYDQGASRTVLTGAPLYVIQRRNVLTAGAAIAPATLTAEPGPEPVLTKLGDLPTAPKRAGEPGPRRPQVITVRGGGKVELYDPAANGSTVSATWQTSLVQSKELISGLEHDLFVFTDGARFEDTKADYWLKGHVIKLWLETRPAANGAPAPTAAAGARPSRVQAIGKVETHSTEYDIKDADLLTVHISDPAPAPSGPAAVPAPPVSSPAPAALAGPVPVGPLPSGAPAAPMPPKPPGPVARQPEKPKPPYRISARTIETWVTRVPAGPGAARPAPKPGDAPGEAGTRYQLDRARCEDHVSVHQDPVDSGKSRGVDVLGRLLLIDGSPDGNKLTVYGTADKLGEVHQEEMSLLGPKVVLDQVHNSAAVEGRGVLTMPTRSDLAGSELKEPETVVIHWRDAMSFNGAEKSAAFAGKVSARQGESWVLCHTMRVVFDRPMYFNQAQRKATPGARTTESAKLDKVFCYPAPADTAETRGELAVLFNQVEYDTAGKLMKAQQLRAQELKMEAQAQDPAGGEKHQRVVADGPGVLTIWQEGQENPSGPAAGGARPAPAKDGKGPISPKGEQEMKLTVIEFRGRMTGIDKGKVFQQATFSEDVTVISAPADSPTAKLDRNAPPPRAVYMRCEKELVVWSHRRTDAPAEQRMQATGNAYLRTDDYDGSAHTIKSEGKAVTLSGNDAVPARIMTRFGQGTEQVGKEIVYDRTAGTYRVKEGFGGSITPGAKNPPPPKNPPLIPKPISSKAKNPNDPEDLPPGDPLAAPFGGPAPPGGTLPGGTIPQK